MSPSPDFHEKPKRKLKGTQSGVWRVAIAPQQAKPIQTSAVERRAFIRCFCQTTARVDDFLPAKVEDVSRGGLKLVVPRRFESGTLLRVEVTMGEEVPLTLLARVIHVTARPESSWTVGCALAKELSENEFEALLT
jgi:hypothetical protein